MRVAECYITADGKYHHSYLEAQHHAEKRYGEAVSSLAHKLVRITKYVAMTDFLTETVTQDALRNILALRADIEVEKLEP